jgi:hypothetical protein
MDRHSSEELDRCERPTPALGVRALPSRGPPVLAVRVAARRATVYKRVYLPGLALGLPDYLAERIVTRARELDLPISAFTSLVRRELEKRTPEHEGGGGGRRK